ncbi:hypothetical protein [Roseinatronobacter monicus]|uniref:hypothetical protein n=1 Tax=Roseinatronobacter monicus TaxID=393481 RepID=UPI003F2CB100
MLNTAHRKDGVPKQDKVYAIRQGRLRGALSPIVAAKIIEIDIWKQIAVFEHFFQRHQINFDRMLFVEQLDTGLRVDRQKGAFVAKQVKHPLALTHKDHPEKLGLVGHHYAHRNAEFGKLRLRHTTSSFSTILSLAGRATPDGAARRVRILAPACPDNWNFRQL